MTTTDDVMPIRVSGPAGLLAVVPTMLGFHPSNSLVLICLNGDRRRVGPVARVDLPAGHDRAMAAQLTAHAVHYADEVVVITYQTSRRRPPVLDDLLGALARAGVDVMDAMVVRGGRARPALNAAMERGHPGVPVPDSDDPQVGVLAAASVFAGRGVLADRAQLRRSIAGPTDDRLRRAVECIAQAAGGPLGLSHVGVQLSAGPPGSVPRDRPGPDPGEHVLRFGPVPDDVEALINRAFGQLADGGAVQVEAAAALAVVMTDAQIRDAVLARGLLEIDRPWLPMLISCATWVPDSLAPALCSVLAMVAYRHGDGALAQVAVDRCLAVEPEHALTHLMIAIMSAGMHPDDLERIALGTSDSIETQRDSP